IRGPVEVELFQLRRDLDDAVALVEPRGCVTVAGGDEEVAGRVDRTTRGRPDRTLPVDWDREALLARLPSGFDRDDAALVVAAIPRQAAERHIDPAVRDRHGRALL